MIVILLTCSRLIQLAEVEKLLLSYHPSPRKGVDYVVRVAVSTILKECMKCSLSPQIIHETSGEGEPLFLAIIS